MDAASAVDMSNDLDVFEGHVPQTPAEEGAGFFDVTPVTPQVDPALFPKGRKAGRITRAVGLVQDVANRMTTLPSDREEVDMTSEAEDNSGAEDEASTQSAAKEVPEYGTVEVDMTKIAQATEAASAPIATSAFENSSQDAAPVSPQTASITDVTPSAQTPAQSAETKTTMDLEPVPGLFARRRARRESERQASEVSRQLAEAALVDLRRQEDLNASIQTAEWQRVTMAHELARQERVRGLNDEDAGYRLDLEDSLGEFLDKPDPLASLWPEGTVIGQALKAGYYNIRMQQLVESTPPTQVTTASSMNDEFALSLARETVGPIASRQTVVERLLDGISAQRQALVLDTDDSMAHDRYRNALETESRKGIGDATGEAQRKLYRDRGNLQTGATPATHVYDAFKELAINAEINDAWDMTMTGEGHSRFRTRDVYRVAQTSEGDVTLVRDPHEQGFRKIFNNDGAIWRNVKTGDSLEGIIKTPKHVDGSTAVFADYAGNEPAEPGPDGSRRVAILMNVVPLALNSEGDTVARSALDTDRRRRRNIDNTINPLARAEARVIADLKQDNKFDHWADRVLQQADSSYADLMLPSGEVTFSVTESDYGRQSLEHLPEPVTVYRANTIGVRELPEPPYGPVR
jgi:hypothetical protein